MKPNLLLFSIVTLAEIVCSYLGVWQGVYFFKPLIMLSLLYWTRHIRHQHLWLWVGMWFALGGDVLLMIRERDLFVVGLGSFLVMQLCYIVAFAKTFTAAGKAQVTTWRVALPFAAYGLSFLAVLYPALVGTPFLIPVIAYSVCLCSMGVFAALRRHSVTDSSYGWVLVGAILFILSDSCIAFNKFLQPFEASTLVVMSTYAAAQWLIVWGMYRKN
ncbi:MAG: lysoplasmalogenase [Spirosomaceae bacterium]|jgi:uncharacterized membrane protein YhhN|nr:lysoplasmalogenase [Spirosomataceae bacterium]